MTASFVRTILLYLLLLGALRLMGKRQLGELEPYELVVAVLISNLASQPLGDIGIPLTYGLVPVVTLTACQLLTAGLGARSLRFRRFLSGRPSVLIENGEIRQAEMRRNGLTPDELFAQLRHNGITDPRTLRAAILETDGTLSLLLYAKSSPLTPDDLHLTPQEHGLPVTIISEGRVLSQNLKATGHDMRWLEKVLRSQGLGDPQAVYVLTVDEQEEVYVLKKQDI